ncbi:MAG: V0D/AC39 family V-type ATPase subunit [Candidatus Howiella sp.]
MLAQQASNAILAKTRAKYGRRLTPKNYRDMVQLGSVADVAAYLKSYTRFSGSLSGLQDAAVHRGNLEKMLFASNIADIKALCHFERSVGEHLFEYVVRSAENDELINFVRLLAAGRPEDYILDLSSTVNGFSRIDFLRLSKVRTFWELVETLSRTHYGKIFRSFPASPTGVPDVTMIEATLDKELYRGTFEMFRESFRGDTRKELELLLGVQGELLNLRRIYRSKKYYGTSPELLRAQMVGAFAHISHRNLEKMLFANSPREIAEILKTTWYRKYLNQYDIENIDYFADCVLQDLCNHKIRMSTHPAVVMFCYIVHTINETENITNIIEGVRYGVGPDEISSMLIRFDREGG